MERRRFVTGLLASAIGIAAPLGVLARSAGANDMINKSGRQRMLSQRMAKAYLQLGQTIDEKRSKKILDASISQFDMQLAELLAYAPTADNKATLADMDTTWQACKLRLGGSSPNQEDARSIMSINEDILALAQAATDQLEKNAGSAAGRLVNISGRQRMLSQRMAKFYQAMRWGVAPADAPGRLDLARGDFINGMKVLEAAPGNTARIRDGLSLAAQQWTFFDTALRQGGGPSGGIQDATSVATTSERILEVMDDITGLYQQLV